MQGDPLHVGSVGPLQPNDPNVTQERRRFRVWQRFTDASRFVFLDETGTATNMTRG
jgi:hypothetical protein